MDNYKGLRRALIAMLADLERAKKKGERAIRHSQAIGGPLKRETVAFMAKFERLSRECLKLEQETREI